MPFSDTSQQRSFGTSSNSFRRYIRTKIFSFGRRRPALIENDDEELDRHDVGHWIVKTAFGGCFVADVNRELEEGGFKVLDVGCGIGTWSLEMATNYPASHFTGIDADEGILPRLTMPKNSRFLVVDITQPLPFEDDSFDFIYWRHMVLALKKTEWPIALTEMRRVLKPGGIMEIFEADYKILNMGPDTRYITELFLKAMKNSQVSPSIVQTLPSLLQRAGFKQNPHITQRACPIGWDDGNVTLGDLMREYWAHSTQTFRPMTTNPDYGSISASEWASEKTQARLENMFKVEFEKYATKEVFVDFVVVK